MFFKSCPNHGYLDRPIFIASHQKQRRPPSVLKSSIADAKDPLEVQTTRRRHDIPLVNQLLLFGR